MAEPTENLAVGLPDDILYQIFYICIFGYCSPKPGSKRPRIAVDCFYHPSNPVTLSHVCSAWRNFIVFNSPEFWARISTVFSTTPEEGKVTLDIYDVEMLELWLLRSHPLPLSVEFLDAGKGAISWHGVPPEVGSAEEEGLTAILEAFARHSNRWSRVALRLGRYSFGGQWWAGLHPEMSMLENCLITTNYSQTGQERIALTHVMSSTSSRLQTLVFDDACWIYRSDGGWIPTIPWTRLTRIRIEQRLDSEKLLEMFVPGSCANLEELAIEYLRGHLYIPPIRQHLPLHTELPHLRILTIHGLQGPPMIFDFVTLPSLTSLTIVLYDDHPIETHKTWEYVARLGARSKWRLTHLRILGGYEYSSGMGQDSRNPTALNHETILHPAFSHLTHLAISPVSNKMLGALTWFDSNRRQPLPRLSVLHTMGFRADQDVLFDMLLSRVRDGGGKPNHSVLRRVQLTDVALEVEEIRQEMQTRLPELLMESPWEDEWVFAGVALRSRYDPRDY
ncbi:hypothetical protein BKA70DRAFT_1285593 [Coprinopsis sp. MPI-PUGE-AT-0042]|nr:hypothetical protein BKA70DRAFT_1285593 [Coprinopsis sp. MPI-PUGE-AT-0042]